MCFIMDTNSLIDLKTLFPTDVFIGLWDDINDIISQDELFSIQEVYSELKSEPNKGFWTDIHVNHGNTFFRELVNDETDQFYQIEALPMYEKVVTKHGGDWSLKKEWSEGTAVADPFLICHSLTHGSTIVTQESQKDNKLNIFSVCKELNIECLNLVQFFRKNSWNYPKL